MQSRRPQISIRNFVVEGQSFFRFDFDITSGEGRVEAIAAGAAVDDFDYLMQLDKTGQAREFSFDFSTVKKIIYPTSSINIVVRIRDFEGVVYDWTHTQQYSVENEYRLVSNPRIAYKSDGSGLIDIFYDYSSPLEIDPATVGLTISKDGGLTWDAPYSSATGDIGTGIPVGPNRRISWNPAVDLPEGGKVVAEISLTNSLGGSVTGQFQTGTLRVDKAEVTTPFIKMTGLTKSQYAVSKGNLYKNNSFDFIAYESSSESFESLSSGSSISSSSRSSLSSEKSSLSSYSSQSSNSSPSSAVSDEPSSRSSQSSVSSISSQSSVSSVSSQSSVSSISSQSSASSISSDSSGSSSSNSALGSMTSDNNIKFLSASLAGTVGATVYGVVKATGYNRGGRFTGLETWRDVETLALGMYHTLGLTSDGTVLAVGLNDDGQCNVNGWTHILKVQVGQYFSVVLKPDQTVNGDGANTYGQLNYTHWTDIIDIAAGASHTVGVKTDGTVVATGYNFQGQCNVSGWTDIVKVVASSVATFGLKSDGTVIAAGTEAASVNGAGWTDIVEISMCRWAKPVFFGRKADGTVMVAGNDYGSGIITPVSGWTNVRQIVGGDDHAVALLYDDEVIAAGRNDDGQCNVTGW